MNKLISKQAPNNNESSKTLPEFGCGQKRRLEVGASSNMQLSTFVSFDPLADCLLSRLFGREAEGYAGMTTIYNLRDLLRFAQCNQSFHKIVFFYIKQLVSFYKDNFSIFNKECFKIRDSKDGIKSLMIRFLEDNTSYKSELGMRFYGGFKQFISGDKLTDGELTDEFYYLLEAFNVVLKTKQANELLNSTLSFLYTSISDARTSARYEKNRALLLISELGKAGCFADFSIDSASYKIDQILIEIVKKLDEILRDEDDEDDDGFEAVYAICIIGQFAKAGMLEKLTPLMIESLLNASEQLSDYDSDYSHEVCMSTLSVLQISGDMLKAISPDVIEKSLFKAKDMLIQEEVEDGDWVYEISCTMAALAKAQILNAISPELIEAIFFEIGRLFSPDMHYGKRRHFNKLVVGNIQIVMNALIRSDLLRTKPNNLIEGIRSCLDKIANRKLIQCNRDLEM